MSVIILGFWVGWLFVFGVLYIYIYRDTLVVLGLAVCCFFFFCLQGGVVITGLYIIIMRFCFVSAFFSSLLVFLLSGILGRGLGGFLSLLQFFIIRIHWWGQWKSIVLHVLYHHHHSPSPSPHGAVENVFIHFFIYFYKLRFLSFQVGNVAS